LTQKKFVPSDSIFPLYSEDLINEIIANVPFTLAQRLLYGNGMMDPRHVAHEIEVHGQIAKTPGWYVAYLDAGATVVHSFSDQEEAEKRLGELNGKEGVQLVNIPSTSK
jgi:hypothetical protein